MYVCTESIVLYVHSNGQPADQEPSSRATASPRCYPDFAEAWIAAQGERISLAGVLLTGARDERAHPTQVHSTQYGGVLRLFDWQILPCTNAARGWQTRKGGP
jgi:hypothetical protein